MQLQNIEAATFRANSRYSLILFDRLPPEQQEYLNDLRKDPDLYGVLIPREPSMGGIKSVCRDTALLYFTLQEPGQLPHYVRATLGAECNQAIAELVLDGLLEIEQAEGFVCGAEAYRWIYENDPQANVQGTIPRLSLAALQYAQALEVTDPLVLSARLYFYNRLPISPRWKRRLPTPAAVKAYLGIEAGGAIRALLDRHWTRLTPSAPNDGWLMWRSRQAAPETASSYKLYLSPACDYLPEAFQALIAVLTERGAPHFKIGQDVYGLLRPDKFVAYFPRFDDVQAAAEQLRRRLSGCPAQGVPFTAEIGSDGLLSWGMDPPRTQQALSWLERESWRLWVTNRLASALLAAKAAAGRTVEPWQFAMERLRLEGVDTTTWTPVATIWRETAGGET